MDAMTTWLCAAALLGLVIFAISTALIWLAWSTFRTAATGYDLREVSTMESASRILDRDGVQIGTLQAVNRQPIPLSSMSPWAVSAVLATEDARFWDHGGIDPLGIARALMRNVTGGGIRQGASTITQQLVRDSFNIRERTYRRKLLEMALALRLERIMPKDEILELYLNRIYFGGGMYGIEAASQGYLGKPASKLNPSESAMLASLVKSPNALSPWRNPSRAEAGRLTVLGQMRDQGSLTASQEKEWASRPPKVLPRRAGKGDSYVAEAVRLAVGELVDPRKAMGGGLNIRTTLDASLQAAAEKAARDHASMVESRPELAARQTLAEFTADLERAPPAPGEPNRKVPSYLQVGLLAVENSTGGILALVGGRSFWHSEYNRATQARRPPGGLSTPFLVLSALEGGLGSHLTFEDWPLDNLFVGVGGAEGVLGEWSVESSDNSYEGPMTMRRLLLLGKNAAAARLGFAVGEGSFTRTLAATGFSPPKDFRASSYVEGIPSSLEELALAYTVFPRLGTRPASAFLISEISDPSGAVLYRHRPEEVRVSSPQSAWLVDDMLREGLAVGPSSRVMEFYPSLTGAGVRAGTSYGFEDVWFAGYDDRVSLAVWLGFDRPSELFRGAFGSQLAAPLWAEVMRRSREKFPQPPTPPHSRPSSMARFDLCPMGRGLLTGRCPPSASASSEYAPLPGPPPCSLHSGHAPPVPREEEDSPWPRAQQLVDNSRIRPVDISGGYVPTTSDPYGSISPASLSALAVRVESAQPASTPAPPPSRPISSPPPQSTPALIQPAPAPSPEAVTESTAKSVPSPSQPPATATATVPEPPLRELSLDP
jgi:penicillin-binding protein 1A